MDEASVGDLLSFDRDVARGWSALARWREGLARDPEAHAAEEPLEGVRRVAGKSAWDELGRLAPSAADAPLRDALRPWVYALTQARIGREDEVARAYAVAAPRGRFAGETPRMVSWPQAWRGLVASRNVAEARLWMDAAAQAGAELGPLARARAGRRVEVARRLGLEHPWSPLVAAPVGSLLRLARRLLDATEELSRAVWREALHGETGAAAVLHAAVAREAGEGWPSRITGRWIEDTFAPGGRAVNVELASLPAAVGASSFARALYAAGFAVRAPTASNAAARRPAVFAIAREPAFAAAHRLAFVFAALPADPFWQARALGVGRRTALAQARILARSALLEVRLHAARLLLGDESHLAPGDVFDEIGPRLFGAPLDARLRGAWPFARDDEPARLLALLQAPAQANELRERYDADWFRNPRAWTHLHALTAAPARESVEEPTLEAGVDRLARALEGSLG
jgi:hypothetical protein